MLVAIASYGEKNIALLHKVIDGCRAMDFGVDIVVFSNTPKDLGSDVDVVVGLPSRDPWSLTFAHKSLFARRVEHYDLFLYIEDDMGITPAHVDAFLRLTPYLEEDEVAGFLRFELDETMTPVLLDAHDRFHLQPEVGRRRGPYVVGQFTNEHAGMYLLTQAQLRRAIATGNFLRPPCEGLYGMPETAATDPYTVCGLRKVICLSALDDYLIQHLSNRYQGKWGVPLPEFRQQVQTQLAIVDGRHPACTLGHRESKLLHGEASKSYYEAPLEPVVGLIPARTKSLLSIGCGWGATEARLARQGIAVTAIPLDSIIGAAASRTGSKWSTARWARASKSSPAAGSMACSSPTCFTCCPSPRMSCSGVARSSASGAPWSPAAPTSARFGRGPSGCLGEPATKSSDRWRPAVSK